MKYWYKGFIFTLMIFCSFESISQDSHLSQFYASPMSVNPAATGMFDGLMRAHIQYRTQWASVAQKPFETAVASFDRPYRRFGAGLYVMNNRAGFGGYNSLNVIISGAHEVTVDPEKIHHLTYGVQLGFIQKSVGFNDLTFNNQYTKNNGGVFDSSLPSNETFSAPKVMMPESAFGILYKRTANFNAVNPFIGVSGFHLTQPKESVFDVKNILPLRIVGHGGAKIRANDQLDINAYAVWMKQKNVTNIYAGAEATYDVQGWSNDLLVGGFYRHRDAVIFLAGITFEEYVVRMSYDFNTSSLKYFSGGKGAFEISLIYRKRKGRYAPSIDI